MDKLVSHKVRVEIGTELTGGIDLGSDPQSGDVAVELFDAVTRSVERAQQLVETGLSLDEIRKRVTKKREALSDSLSTGEWKKQFRGRDILRKFCGEHVRGMRYEYFRDLVITEMASAGHQPGGMKAILDRILDD